MKAVIALALLSCIAIGLADFNQESDETRVLRRSKRAAEPTFSNSKAKSFKKKAGKGQKKAGKGPKKAGKSGKAMKKKSGKAGKRRRTGKKGQKKKAKKTKSGKGKKTKSALSGVRAGGRVLKGNGCEYVSLNEVIANGIGCANGFKFVLKGATNTRRQFLIINDKVILAFVAAGTKFPECTSFTDVTANVDCKAVTDLINVDLAATATTTAAGATTTASTVADTTTAAADTTSTTSAATTTTGSGCGYSVTDPIPSATRIVGGQEVNPPHRLPYQALVEIRFASGIGFSCGGTLLNKRYVLTASHCIEHQGEIASDVKVTLGEHRRRESMDTESYPVQDIKVQKVIPHPDWNILTLDDDIAILQLSTEATITTNVVPVCLPKDTNDDYVNRDAIVSGWGGLSFEGNSSNVLMEATVKIIANSDDNCTVKINGVQETNLPVTVMCAYTPDKDACQGDSGGPLVVLEDGRYVVVGVVSIGDECALPGHAGVYARVTTYLDWINENIADGE